MVTVGAKQKWSPEDFGPKRFKITFKKKQKCRYAENPQTPGSVYYITSIKGLENIIDPALMNAKQHQGKTMSFNNFLDANANLRIMREFDSKFNEFEEKHWCSITKHANPAGVAGSDNPKTAFWSAWGCDPLSAFGGIVCTNFGIDDELAHVILSDNRFIEAVIAPSYTQDALNAFQVKKNVRVLEMDVSMPEHVEYDIRLITGGALLQEIDRTRLTKEMLTYPNELVKDLDFKLREPTNKQIEDMIFGWYVNRNTKSNTVLLVKDMATVGIGAGQQNRVDSGFIAGFRANKHYAKLSDPTHKIEELTSEQEEMLRKLGMPKKLYQLINYLSITTEGRSEGSVAVSSAFYPMPDTPYVLGLLGVAASLSPSGSIKDKLAYKALYEMGIAAAHTDVLPDDKEGYKGGRRAFYH
jgi:phosphoribosylaminoimidazolecarboxamide formyltransferase/IMP cyclohydrolase